MSTKSKGFFKKLLGTVLSAACLLSGTATAGTIASTASLPVSAATSAGDASTFSWDNATVYFLLTDRFYNGNQSNDNSYGRVKTVAGDSRATFHGGDFAGITQKINEGYFDDLGVNAIWLSAPYEQLHGYIIGDNFAHYSYHGYYVTDYTETDANFGTKEEFRTMVDTAHEHGIRIVLDIVMNHAGYNNMIDMNEYNYGTLLDGWKTVYDAGDLANYHKKIDYESSAADWARWWGPDWVRSGLPGYTQGGGDDRTRTLEGLPDFKTEQTSQVSIPQFLITKWTQEGTLSAKQAKYGTSNTVTGFISSWLAEWVREYGVDGFRCDTAKHVDYASWNQLKTTCVAALKEWKANNPTKKLDDLDFWMTGECWDHGSYKDAYYTEGGFDSMINFETQGGGYLNSGSIAGVYENYAGKINSDPSFNLLSYISSHDTVLARGDQYYLGSALLMLPGGVQIYYGDETCRPLVPGIAVTGDGHAVRSDMNWDSMDKDVLAHWQKVGTFRHDHISVGAGANVSLTASSGVGFGRTYSKNGITDTVAAVIAASANTSVTLDVSDLWPNGTTLTNYYDDSSATVTGGKITFNSGAHGTILIAEPDGSKGRVIVTHINKDTGDTIKTETLVGIVGESYSTSALSTEGYKLASTTGQTSGVYAEGEINVTYYYTFDSTNYAYIVTKHVDAATNAEIAESTTQVAKVGSTYTTVPADIKNYEVDLTKSTNISGTVKTGTTTATYKYNYVEPTNLIVHYYNSNNWPSVSIYAYDESGASVVKYTGAWPGAAMTAEGDGWYSYEVEDTESAQVIMNNNGGGAQDPAGTSTPGYDASGEVWIKNGTVSTGGKVKVIYQTTSGTILGTETLTGIADGTTTYTTTAKTFSGYTLRSTPDNATGVYTSSTITVTYLYTSDAPEELVNTSSISSESIKAGGTVTVNGSATGGTAPYTYAVYYKLSSASSYTTAQNYSSSASKSISLSTAGTYVVLSKVKDSDGNIAQKQFTVVVDPGGSTLKNNSKMSAETITLGSSVTLTGAASGGTAPYTYAFYYKLSTASSYTTLQNFSSTKTYTLKPTAAGVYDVVIKVKDSSSATARLQLSLTVKGSDLTNNSKMSSTSIALGNSVTLTGAASGGTSPYTYAFYYKKSTASSYTTISNFTSTKTATFKPTAAGTYDVVIKVKDSANATARKQFSLTVISVLTNSSKISATTITLGDTLTVTGAASGGTSPYNYAVFYKKTSDSSYTTAQKYSTNKTVKIKPAKATTYKVLVRVKDSEGTYVDKTFSVTVKPLPLTNKSTMSAKSIVLGNSVTLTGAATGGTTPYTYAFYYKKSTASSYTTLKSFSTTKTVTLKPTASGTYDVVIKVKDSAGTVERNQYSLTVTKPLTNSSKLSATTIALGNSVTLTGAATGGTSPYYYAFYYKKSTDSSYTTLKAFSTTKTVTLKPTASGTYDVVIKVKDSTGAVERKQYSLTVTKALTNSSKISATSIAKGSSVTVTCAATGGTSSYTYAVYYKKEVATSYMTAQDYSTNKTVKITPAASTDYEIVVRVKDSAGTIASKSFTVSVI